MKIGDKVMAILSVGGVDVEIVDVRIDENMDYKFLCKLTNKAWKDTPPEWIPHVCLRELNHE